MSRPGQRRAGAGTSAGRIAERPVVVPPQVRRAVVRHARRAWPGECCGLLIGSGHQITHAVAVENVARARARYAIDPRVHIELRRVLRRFEPRVEIVGVYHSHPDGRPVPSRIDVRDAAYPEWLYLIVGLAGRRARLAGWRLRGGGARVVRLVRVVRPAAPQKRRRPASGQGATGGRRSSDGG